MNGEEIECTGGHPFYVEGKGFIPAKELKSGDKCLLSTGEDVTIEKVEVEQLTEAETTYNFEVADFHTYYVTGKNVLVHNKCAAGDTDFKMANRGQSSTGRRSPYNLKEKLAMEQAMSNPLDGTEIISNLKDSRWLSSDGWIKMQQTFQFYDNSRTVIHYVLNRSLRLMDDFKFVYPM